MSPQVDLMVPVKPLHQAKSRLRADAKSRPHDDSSAAAERHRRLVLALVRDTVAAASSAARVRRLLAICSDPAAVDVLTADGVEVVADEPDAGLNPALRHGAALLRADDPAATVGALQADLPALRPGELDAAIGAFAELHAARAFCPDRAGTGSTLLLAEAGTELDPRFGTGSANAHSASGALRLDGPWPSLRCDVDTATDLAAATALGLGPHTTAAIGRPA